jgi:pyridoxine kinase
MGDGGRLYNGIGQKQVQLMREMVGVAHLIFPNYTEACYLTDQSFRAEGLSREEACRMLDRLIGLGTKSAIITSGIVDGKNQVCGFDHNDATYFFHEYEEIPGLFHGTGDIFSAVLIGHLMKGKCLSVSTRLAMDVVSQMISRNRDVKDRNCGIFIERCLDLL